jgi:outer membrane biosynthesis protein TonB
VRRNDTLAYAFAISIALHLTVLPFVHPQATVAQEEDPRVLHVDRMPTPPPTPPPTPTPRPTRPPTPPPRATAPPPAQRPQTHVRIHVAHQDAHPRTGPGEQPNAHATGDPNAAPAAPGTAAPGPSDATAAPVAPPPTPTPRPTPTPLTCARPNVAPATLRAAPPDVPPLAQQQGVAGIVQVVVSLDTQSRIVGTRVLASPSTLLNQAALASARESQFRTEIRNCEPVAADYIFTVDFTSQ